VLIAIHVLHSSLSVSLINKKKCSKKWFCVQRQNNRDLCDFATKGILAGGKHLTTITKVLSNPNSQIHVLKVSLIYHLRMRLSQALEILDAQKSELTNYCCSAMARILPFIVFNSAFLYEDNYYKSSLGWNNYSQIIMC
jgi:hypothetical protein